MGSKFTSTYIGHINVMIHLEIFWYVENLTIRVFKFMYSLSFAVNLGLIFQNYFHKWHYYSRPPFGLNIYHLQWLIFSDLCSVIRYSVIYNLCQIFIFQRHSLKNDKPIPQYFFREICTIHWYHPRKQSWFSKDSVKNICKIPGWSEIYGMEKDKLVFNFNGHSWCEY